MVTFDDPDDVVGGMLARLRATGERLTCSAVGVWIEPELTKEEATEKDFINNLARFSASWLTIMLMAVRVWQQSATAVGGKQLPEWLTAALEGVNQRIMKRETT